MPDTVSRFELAAAELRALGIVLTQLPGEYRVNYRNGGDGTVRRGSRAGGRAWPRARGQRAGDAGASRAAAVAHDGEGHPPPKDQGAQLPFAGAGAETAARGGPSVDAVLEMLKPAVEI